jgi:hypothetical protein
MANPFPYEDQLSASCLLMKIIAAVLTLARSVEVEDSDDTRAAGSGDGTRISSFPGSKAIVDIDICREMCINWTRTARKQKSTLSELVF